MELVQTQRAPAHPAGAGSFVLTVSAMKVSAYTLSPVNLVKRLERIVKVFFYR